MKSEITSLLRSPAVTLLAVTIAGIVVLTIQSGGQFLSPISVNTFFQFLAIPILIGLAQMATLAVGQMNLAVGSIGGFATCLAGVLIVDIGLPAWLGAVVAILVGLAAGIVNGLIVIVTKINGFIVTLATLTILSGAQYAVVGTRTLPAQKWPELQAIGTTAPLGIPLIFLIAILISIVLSLGYRNFNFARNMLATGGNPLAATLSGISTNRSIVMAHGLSGLLTGIAAFIALCSLPGANKSIGGDWLLSSFAAPIIGGVALSGGLVAVLGTVLAAIVVRLVDSARAAFQLDPSWVNLVIGAVVLGTVALGRLRQRQPTEMRADNSPPDPTAPPPHPTLPETQETVTPNRVVTELGVRSSK